MPGEKKRADERGLSLPPADTDAAKELYKQMQDRLGFNPRATMGVS